MSENDHGEVVAEAGGLVDETGVCLAVYGSELNPEDVTSRLGCLPTRAHRRGDRQGPHSPPFADGAWILEERGVAPTGPAQLVRRLLMRLPSDGPTWERLAADYDLQLRFGVHFSGWNKGFDLSSELVETLARTRVRLVFDLYAYGDEDA